VDATISVSEVQKSIVDIERATTFAATTQQLASHPRVGHYLTDQDVEDAAGLSTAATELVGAVREVLSSPLGPLGIATKLEALRPRRDDVVRAIGRFEARTDARWEDLANTRARIESGELVRDPSGELKAVKRAPLTPELAIRQMEIRTFLRGVNRTELFDVIKRAYEEGDAELLDAAETAPRAMSILDDSTRTHLKQWRLNAARWDSVYQNGRETVKTRRQISDRARQAFGIKSASDSGSGLKLREESGRMVITKEDARDAAKYRTAAVLAEAGGHELVIAE